MVSDLATKVPTQQSVKAYVDASKGANSDITSMTGITGAILTPTNLGSKTTASWSKSIGSGGDYADWATMIAAMPDMIAHAVTVTIKAGTTLTEECAIKNKHGLTSDAKITIQAEKYFPTSGVLPTADSATATTLRDAALATAAVGNDYFNDCWVFVVDGTGTDNGFVAITDYVDATGDVVVASWPGTQPDNTSRYLIVGALVDCGGTITNGFYSANNTAQVFIKGVGITDANSYGLRNNTCAHIAVRYCGIDKSDLAGMYHQRGLQCEAYYCGLVGNNVDSSSVMGGIRVEAMLYSDISLCGISDNDDYGILVSRGGYARILNNFGDNNGVWGTYAEDSAQIQVGGAECSGSSGNHSDPGTAGTANADQAAVY